MYRSDRISDCRIDETPSSPGFALVRKCYSDYRMWKRDEVENHWTVLVISEIEQSVIAMESPRKEPRTRADRLAAEREIVRQILKEAPASRIDQLKLWGETHEP